MFNLHEINVWFSFAPVICPVRKHLKWFFYVPEACCYEIFFPEGLRSKDADKIAKK